MDVEHGLLCAVLAEETLTYALDHKVNEEMFTDQRMVNIWHMCLEHWAEYGKVPTPEVIATAYPTFEFEIPDQPLTWWVDEIRDRLLHRKLMEKVTEAFSEEELEGPRPGTRLLAHLREGVSAALAEVPAGTDVDYFESWEERVLPRLLERMENPGYLRGISTGYEGIDRASGGFQKGQLITVVGTPKAGKSTIALDMAKVARYDSHTCLFFTFEMSALEQEDRLASLISGVNFNHIINGTISKMELARIKRAHRIRQLLHGLTLVDAPSGTMTVSAVQAKIRLYQPGLVIIDGVYLMDDELGEPPGTPRALTNITRNLKRVAQQEKTPILITTQALLARSKGGIQMDSVGYSSSFVQDSDMVLGAYDLGGGIKKFSVVAIRTGPKTETYVEIDWNRGMIEEIPPQMVDIKVAIAEQAKQSSTGSVAFDEEEDELVS